MRKQLGVAPSDPADGVSKGYADTITPNTRPTNETAYTLTLTDIGRVTETTNAAANTVTIPAHSTVPFPINGVAEIFQYGTGPTTIVAASGVVIRSVGNLVKLASQYTSVALRKRAADEWVLIGNLSA